MAENVVRISEIAACVAQTIAKINDGVAAARAAGINAELPPEVKFSMLVVYDWQALEIEKSTTQGETGSVDGTRSDSDTSRSRTEGTQAEHSTQSHGKHVQIFDGTE